MVTIKSLTDCVSYDLPVTIFLEQDDRICIAEIFFAIDKTALILNLFHDKKK